VNEASFSFDEATRKQSVRNLQRVLLAFFPPVTGPTLVVTLRSGSLLQRAAQALVGINSLELGLKAKRT